MLNSVIQGFTWILPKQPQEAAPVRALYSVMVEKAAKHSILVSHAAFLNRPESSQSPSASSNSTVKIKNGLYDQISLLATGSVSSCQPFRAAVMSSSAVRSFATISVILSTIN